MHRMNDHSPDQQVGVIAAERQRRQQRIVSHQTPTRRTAFKAPQQQLSCVHHNHCRTAARRHAAINHQQVTVTDATGGHGLTLNPQKKGRTRMGHQLNIEIDRSLDIVGRRTGKTSGHRLKG